MDPILTAFVEAQWQEGSALAEQSDLLELERIDPQHIVAEFSCRGLVRGRNGQVSIAERFSIGFNFADHYLRVPDSERAATWLAPREIWHPNVRCPLVCLGKIIPGTLLVELLFRAHTLLGYQNVTVSEFDALNLEACQWARSNLHLFPIDARPLKRRRVEPRIDQMEVA